jgi:hypothetical protein
VKPPKKDKVDPKEGEDDGGVITDDDDDKPSNGSNRPGDDPDPALKSISHAMLREDFDKALQARKAILYDKSLSEEVRTVHLRKSKLRIENLSREMGARNPAQFPLEKSAISPREIQRNFPQTYKRELSRQRRKIAFTHRGH